MGHILHFFGDVDLRCQHDGLGEICKKEKIDVRKLQAGEYIIFVNHARDRVKLFTTSNIIAYLRLTKGQGKIDLRTIQYIPKAFEGSGKIDYDKSLKEFVEANLVKKGKKEVLEAGASHMSPLDTAREITKVVNMTEEEKRGLAGELVLTNEEEIIEPTTNKKEKVILRKKGER